MYNPRFKGSACGNKNINTCFLSNSILFTLGKAFPPHAKADKEHCPERAASPADRPVFAVHYACPGGLRALQPLRGPRSAASCIDSPFPAQETSRAQRCLTYGPVNRGLNHSIKLLLLGKGSSRGKHKAENLLCPCLQKRLCSGRQGAPGRKNIVNDTHYFILN